MPFLEKMHFGHSNYVIFACPKSFVMNKLTLITALLIIGNVTYAQKMKNEIDTVSYALGASVANNLKKEGMTEYNSEAFKKGFEDAFSEKGPSIPQAEMDQMINTYFTNLRNAKFEKVKAENAQFLEENKKREGVTVLPSGLQYEVITMGEGTKPAATDKVTTHYHGTLIDGTVFDSSVERGQPIQFPVNGVISGWQEALQLMPVGSKWKLYIPYDLAYGPNGQGPKIGPYATLIFEVELISIDQ